MIRIQRFIEDMKHRQWLDTIELPAWEMQRARYIRPGEYEYEQAEVNEDEQADKAMQRLNPLNSVHGTTYFLSKRVEIPAEWQDQAVGLIFEAGGEGLLKVNGMPYHGLDRNDGLYPYREVG